MHPYNKSHYLKHCQTNVECWHMLYISLWKYTNYSPITIFIIAFISTYVNRLQIYFFATSIVLIIEKVNKYGKVI